MLAYLSTIPFLLFIVILILAVDLKSCNTQEVKGFLKEAFKVIGILLIMSIVAISWGCTMALISAIMTK